MAAGRLLGLGRALADARTTYRLYSAVTEAGVQAAVAREIAHVVVLRGAANKLLGPHVPDKTHPDQNFPNRVQGASLCIPVKTAGGIVLVQFAHRDFKLTEDLRALRVFDRLPTIIVFRATDMRHLDALPLGKQRKLLEDPIGYITENAVFIITPSTVFGRTEHKPMLQAPEVDPRTFRFDDFASVSFQRNIAHHVRSRTLMEIAELVGG